LQRGFDLRCTEAVDGPYQFNPVRLHALGETQAIRGGADLDASCAVVEMDQAAREPVDVAAAHCAIPYGRIQHVLRGQPAHLDEPVNNGAFAADLEPTFISGQRERHGAKIDLAREPAVELDLPLAVKAACLQRREVEKRVAHGFLELVDQPVAQKNP
jgi:hypothetical protein